VPTVGGAHAPSPDVRVRPPGFRSLGGVCAPASMPPLAAYAGSQGMGTPDLTIRLNLIRISELG